MGPQNDDIEDSQTDDTETEDTEQQDDSGDQQGGDEESSQAASGEPQRPTRKERRANRMREANERASRFEREAATMRQQMAEYQAQLAEMRGRVEEQSRQRSQPDPQAAFKERIKGLRQQWESAAALASSAKNPADQRRYLEQAYDLEEQMQHARFEAWQAQQPRQQQQQDPGQSDPIRIAIASEFPAVVTNPKLRRRADAYFEDLVEEGKAANHGTLREAILMAQRDLKIGGQAAPGNQSRQRFVGASAGEGEGGGGGSSRGMSADDVRNNRHFKKMAELSYPDKEPEQAWALWAKNQGSKVNGVGA